MKIVLKEFLRIIKISLKISKKKVLLFHHHKTSLYWSQIIVMFLKKYEKCIRNIKREFNQLVYKFWDFYYLTCSIILSKSIYGSSFGYPIYDKSLTI